MVAARRSRLLAAGNDDAVGCWRCSIERNRRLAARQERTYGLLQYLRQMLFAALAAGMAAR